MKSISLRQAESQGIIAARSVTAQLFAVAYFFLDLKRNGAHVFHAIYFDDVEGLCDNHQYVASVGRQRFSDSDFDTAFGPNNLGDRNSVSV